MPGTPPPPFAPPPIAPPPPVAPPHAVDGLGGAPASPQSMEDNSKEASQRFIVEAINICDADYVFKGSGIDYLKDMRDNNKYKLGKEKLAGVFTCMLASSIAAKYAPKSGSPKVSSKDIAELLWSRVNKSFPSFEMTLYSPSGGIDPNNGKIVVVLARPTQPVPNPAPLKIRQSSPATRLTIFVCRGRSTKLQRHLAISR